LSTKFWIELILWFRALDVAGEAAHAVINYDDIGIEAVDEVVQGAQRRDLAAGGYVYVGAKGAGAAVRMRLRIGMDRDVALVQVRHHGFLVRLLQTQAGLGGAGLAIVRRVRQRAGRLGVERLLLERQLGNQHRHARPLGVVILVCDVEDAGADDLRHLRQDGGQALGIVGLVNVGDVFLLCLLALGVANIVDVEAQRLGEIVETLEPQLFKRF